jgi:hypothetical protein
MVEAESPVISVGGVAPTVIQQRFAFMFHAEGWINGASLVKTEGVAGGEVSADDAVNTTSPGCSTPAGMGMVLIFS